MMTRRRLRGKSEARSFIVSIFVTRGDRVLILWFVSQVESHLITDVHPGDLHIVTLRTSSTKDRYPIYVKFNRR
jgi:hypothetical protein